MKVETSKTETPLFVRKSEVPKPSTTHGFSGLITYLFEHNPAFHSLTFVDQSDLAAQLHAPVYSELYIPCLASVLLLT